MSPHDLGLKIADRITIGGVEVRTARPPAGLIVQEHLGLLTTQYLHGQVIYRAAGALYEARAVKTPQGDYLLMFPTNTKDQPLLENCHYAGKATKVNDMVAFRSKDLGKTWTGPTIAFDIDYNQHGFVPLIPRGSKRIYAFGTQPVWNHFVCERGQQENAPIGYRYSDDDGYTWSDVRLIQPVNDPGFKGMAVMRMCETDSGAWLIAPHEGDWSCKPLMTRLYVLRSENQGQTWTLLPERRPNGWFVPGFNRMDEGRPINLGGGRILMLARTPEGHLWELRSFDDGLTWSKPRPTPLVHPDAPPMLFHLSDGRTLIAFHHNRFSDHHYSGLGDKIEVMKDRSEIWVSTSHDEGHTWSRPRFLFANALAPNFKSAWRNYQCSYLDMLADEGLLHIFLPHRWHQLLHLEMPESALPSLPTTAQIE